MKKIGALALKILLGIVLGALGFFAVTFIIYFFNLDMKATSMLAPFLEKWFDKMDRKQYI